MVRKGMSAEAAIILLVVFGIVMIIVAILYTSLFDIGQKEFSKAECRASLLLTSSVQGGYDSVAQCYKELANPIPIKCSRRFIDVTADDVTRDGKSIREEYNADCKEAGLAGHVNAGACLTQNVVANEMASCWDTFFRGETRVFQQVEQELDGVFDDNEHDRACFVCAEITLDAGKDISGFSDYLKDKKYLFGGSYYDFLARNPEAYCNPSIRSGSDDGTCWSAFGKEIPSGWFSGLGLAPQDWPGALQGTIPDGQTYAITFVRYGMEAACEEEDDRSDAPTMTVQVLPAARISEYCDVVLA